MVLSNILQKAIQFFFKDVKGKNKFQLMRDASLEVIFCDN